MFEDVHCDDDVGGAVLEWQLGAGIDPDDLDVIEVADVGTYHRVVGTKCSFRQSLRARPDVNDSDGARRDLNGGSFDNLTQ